MLFFLQMRNGDLGELGFGRFWAGQQQDNGESRCMREGGLTGATGRGGMA